MKAVGIVRNLDDLGRIVVPREVRRMFGVEVKDSMEIFTDGDLIVLQKYERGCTFCGEIEEDMRSFKRHEVCSHCLSELTFLSYAQVAASSKS